MDMHTVGQEQIAVVQSLLDCMAGKAMTEDEKQRATEFLRAATLLLTAGVRFPHRLEGFSISTQRSADS